MEYTLKSQNKSDTFSITNYLHEIGINNVKEEILKGLTSSSKYIPSKYFYDKKGSILFEEITKLDDYYPTRTEKSILKNILSELNLDFNNLSIIELGSGDASKISLLFNQIPQSYFNNIYYYPIDISYSAIEKSASFLSNKYNGIKINGITADFIHQIEVLPKVNNRLICFLGSTIGNLNSNEIQQFLETLGSFMLKGDNFLLGIDMIKDIEILEKAYNDNKGITAEFNKNILSVVNKLIGTNFNKNQFSHFAYFNTKKNRIEMHLKVLESMTLNINNENCFEKITMEKGDKIHTENSHKFSIENIEQFAKWSGLSIKNIFTDKNKWFSVVHFQK